MKANPKATGRIGYSLSVLVGVFFACASVWFCIQQFLFTIPLLLASSLRAFGAWRYQTLWLVVTPLVIALGSLYPWTGNLTFQERDALLSAILAGRMVREMSGDQLSLYTTRNNTLQQATGYAMAAAFVPLIFAAFRRDANHGVSANFQAFSTGMQLTAFFVSLIVVLERLVTVGVFNFKEELRATGPLVSMHIGGQHIDAFWGFALPSPLPWKVRFRTQPAGEELGLMHVMVCH